MTSIISISIFALLSNIYLGKIRIKTKKFSISWFVLIHAAVPVIIACRIGFDVPHWASIIFVVLSGIGQLIGSRLTGNED